MSLLLNSIIALTALCSILQSEEFERTTYSTCLSGTFDTLIRSNEHNWCSDATPAFCNERGDHSFTLKNYSLALQDYQTAIDYIEQNQIVDPSNLIRGICGSMFCYDLLNEEEAAKQQFEKLVYHVSLLGRDIENIDWFRNSPFYSFYEENRDLREAQILRVDMPDMTPEESCQFQCDGYALAAGIACGKVLNPIIQAACIGCIFGLQQLCVRCCKGEGFWKNCVKGLRRLFHDPEHPKNPAPHPYE